MYKFHKNDLIDIDLYESRINKNGYIVYDRQRMEDTLLYMQSTAATYANFSQETMLFRSAGSYYMLTPDAVFAYLTRTEHCPEHYFFNRSSKTGRPSLDMRRVLSKALANGYAKEFLEDYMKYRSLTVRCNDVQSIVTKCGIPAGVGKDGTKLHRIPYTAVRQKNLRFNYNNFDIIAQIPKEFCDCITVEDGYVLAWGDFAQSDFRIAYNLFLRSKENDKIMLQYKDKYEALARIVSATMGTDFDLEQFKEERDVYKVMTLAVMYGTRDSPVKAEQAFIRNFSAFLQKCPKYAEYYSRLKKRVVLGLPIIADSYFGNETVIPVWADHPDSMVNDALNSPVQTGTSEIIILTVNAILDMFYSLGYTEEDISVYYVRHDEPIFKIKEETMKDCWVFNQFASILVDDWIPLELSFDYGYCYKVPSVDLEKYAEKVYAENEYRIDKFAHGTEIDTIYYPVADVLILYVHWIVIGGKCIVTYYSKELNQVMYSLLDTVVEEEILLGVKQRIQEFEPRVYNAGYHGMLLYNNFIEDSQYFGRSFVKFKKEISTSMNDVIVLCKAMVVRYCRKEGLECTYEVRINDSQKYLENVSDFLLLIGGED